MSGFGNLGPPGDSVATDAAETLAGAVAEDGTPTPGQPAVVVVEANPQATFITAPPESTAAPAVRLVGDGTDRFGEPILRVEVVPDEPITVIQGDGSGDPADTPPWLMQTVKDMVAEPIATETTAEAIRDRLPPALEGGRLATETELDATGPLATEAKQDTANASLASIDSKTPALTGGRQPVDGSGVTQPISVVALPLPLGAATSVAQADLLAAFEATLGAYGRTSFGQIRVAMRETQFDNVQEYGLDTRAWGTQTATGGTVAFNTTTGMTDLTVTSSSGSTAKLRTNTHFIYQPGAVTRVILTLAHSTAGHAGQVRRWGFFNDSDGIFFELNGTSLSLVRRTSTSGSPVDNPIAQDSWLDPNGAPTLTFGNRFEIDLQWLSFGTVRIWINGNLVHVFEFANAITLPYTRTAQLPISLEIVNTGASTPATMSYVCSTVYLDGGTPLRFVPRERALSTPKMGIGTTYTPLIGLRMASSVGGRVNRKVVIPTTSRVANASGRATVAVLLNPTSTTGGTWTQTDPSSGVEYNEGITAYTGGAELSRIFLPNTADSRELDGESSFALNGLHLRRDAFNTTGDMVLFVGKADVGTSDIDIVARWKELG